VKNGEKIRIMRNTVLIVEDHNITNQLYAEYLRREGFEVLQCDSAFEGVDMLSRYSYRYSDFGYKPA